MPDPASGAANGAPALPLCASSELVERGRAFVWDVLLWRQPARAFVLRVDGRLVAYVNRCAHVPVEMDWQPGEFLDAERQAIVCSIHGASYAPDDGRCIGGPCGRSRLLPVAVAEHDGQACWYPSTEIRPVAFDDPAPSPSPAPSLR